MFDPLSMPVFNPQSPQAAAISGLFVTVLWACAIILCVVSAMLLYGLLRYRQKPGQKDPRPSYGNVKLETLWTVLPLLLVLWLLSLSAEGMRGSQPPMDQPPDLVVTGHQWWWEADYPKSGIRTANEIHIPVAERWLVELRSADVIHDFWVPSLAPKMDAIPGHPNRFWLEADKTGSYLGSCSEFCGAQHAQMHFMVLAEDGPAFKAWQGLQEKSAPHPQSGAALEGSLVFQKMACASCHQVRGTAAIGLTAPDLTHFGSRRSFGAVLLSNTPENLARWLRDPQSLKPGTQMPDLKLKAPQVKSLVAYLESLP